MGRKNKLEPAPALKHYKLVILGDTAVGKSSLIEYETHGKDLDCMQPTFVSSYCCISPKECIRFDSWEVAGREW